MEIEVQERYQDILLARMEAFYSSTLYKYTTCFWILNLAFFLIMWNKVYFYFIIIIIIIIIVIIIIKKS